jgi:hypothetical protein
VAYAILPKTKRPTKRFDTMGDVGSDITRLERPGTSGVGLGVGEVGGWGALAVVVGTPAHGLPLGGAPDPGSCKDLESLSRTSGTEKGRIYPGAGS